MIITRRRKYIETPLDRLGGLFNRIPRLPDETNLDYRERINSINQYERSGTVQSLHDYLTSVFSNTATLTHTYLYDKDSATLLNTPDSGSLALMADTDGDGTFSTYSDAAVVGNIVKITLSSHPTITEQTPVKVSYTVDSVPIKEVNQPFLDTQDYDDNYVLNPDLYFNYNQTSAIIDDANTIAVTNPARQSDYATLDTEIDQHKRWSNFKWDDHAFDGVFNGARLPVTYDVAITDTINDQSINGTGYGDDARCIGFNKHSCPVFSPGVIYFKGHIYYLMNGAHSVVLNTGSNILDTTSYPAPHPDMPIIANPLESKQLRIQPTAIDTIEGNYSLAADSDVDGSDNLTVPGTSGETLPDVLHVEYISSGRTYIDAFSEPASWTVTLNHTPDAGEDIHCSWPKEATQLIVNADVALPDTYHKPNTVLHELPQPPYDDEGTDTSLIITTAQNVPDIANLTLAGHVTEILPEADTGGSLNELLDGTYPDMWFSYQILDNGNVEFNFSETADNGWYIFYQPATSEDTNVSLRPSNSPVLDTHNTALHGSTYVLTEKRSVATVSITANALEMPAGLGFTFIATVTDVYGCGLRDQEVSLYVDDVEGPLRSTNTNGQAVFTYTPPIAGTYEINIRHNSISSTTLEIKSQG